MTTFKGFTSALKNNGLSKSNLFEVEIPLPQSIQDQFKGSNDSVFGKAVSIVSQIIGKGGAYTRGLSLMCEAVQLPGKGLVTTEHRKNTSQIKMPYGVLFDDIAFNFYVSSDMYEKAIIDAWMDLIYDHKTHTLGFYEDYVQYIKIHKLDSKGNRVETVTLKDAYPLAITPLDLNMGTNDELSRLSVTFTYHKWFKGDDEGIDIFDDPIGALTDFIEKPDLVNSLSKVYDAATGQGASAFTGEALNVYNKMSNLTKKYTGVAANEVAVMIGRVKSDFNSASAITQPDKDSLNTVADNIINRLKG